MTMRFTPPRNVVKWLRAWSAFLCLLAVGEALFSWRFPGPALAADLASHVVEQSPDATPTPPSTPQPAATPDRPLSMIEQIAQMEAEDEANGLLDARTAPYAVVEVVPLQQRLFLPLLVGGEDASPRSQEISPWPAMAPPGSALTPEEQAELEASHADAEAYVRGLLEAYVSAAGVNAPASTIRKSASVGGLNTWKVPNTPAYVNYCGPATMQVTIDAQLPVSDVPNIDEMARRINQVTPGGFDPNRNPAITDTAMCRYLWHHYVHVIRLGERYLQQPSRGTAQQTLWNQLVRHVDRNYTIPTGAITTHLDSWSRPNVKHVIALIGYDADLVNAIYPVVMHSVRYTEPADTRAGYVGGKFKIWLPGWRMWQAINGEPNNSNNTQCLLRSDL